MQTISAIVKLQKVFSWNEKNIKPMILKDVADII
jgi:DNA-directed RNA polymerase specialized sigma54-like protein